MFPFVRFIKDILIARRMPPITEVGEIHVSHHICWPWDLDMFAELNNGRMLTLYDLGRFALAQRGGLIDVLIKRKWVLTMAGATVRYRRRITGFERFEMRSRFIGWDDRFMYLEQSMWKKNGECASHVLYRSAALSKGKAVAPSEVAIALGQDPVSPPLPKWVTAWIEAEAKRTWPPMSEPVQ